jgi:minor extracellular serine protease Vpr
MARSLGVFLLLPAAVFGQARTRPVDYALILEDAPAAQRATRAARLPRIQRAHRTLRAELERRQIPVHAATQLLANAIFVTVPPDREDELRALPGVRRIQALPRLVPALDRALDLVNAPAAWSILGGKDKAGAGVKIGIIDSGIDQTHPGFQDSTLSPPDGFPKGEADFTNGKVIVARSYVAQLAKISPDFYFPDDLTPRDRVGHGTAIAMIAAGVGHTAPLGDIQGVAPKAWLGNYKIFGSPGVNAGSLYGVLAQAMEDAFRDGMDIVTLALNEGDPAIYGPLDRDPVCSSNGVDVADCDIRAQLIETATRNGMLVVAAAGNDGNAGTRFPTLNSIHTPATAPSALTVGAVTNSHRLYATVQAEGGAAIAAAWGDGRKIDAPLTAPVGLPPGDGLVCAALPAGSLTGKVALIQRGTCAMADKINYAQNAGAVAVVLYQTDGLEEPIAKLFAETTGIPAVSVGFSDGSALRAAAGSGVKITLDPTLRVWDSTPATVADFSSRGPAIVTYGIKPEVAAVGAGIYTAAQRIDPNGYAYDRSGYTTVSGTSFAVGMAAGAAALVKQQFPTLKPGQIKSAVVNTANQNVRSRDGQARTTDVGAGLLNVADAVSVAAVVEPSTLSFGLIPSTTVQSGLTLTITNVSSSAATFSLAVNPRDQDARATVTVSPASVTLEPGKSDVVTVTLSGARPDPGSYEGFIDITGAGPALHVPYLYLVADGTPYNIFTLQNGGFTGAVYDDFWLLIFKVVDQFGVPVRSLPVNFNVVSGNAKLTRGDTATDIVGKAGVWATLSSQPGDQVFRGTAGPLSVDFFGYARAFPQIARAAPASGSTAIAAGAVISLFGTDLSDCTATAGPTDLPLALGTVSVSFSGGGISLPGRVRSVSPGQVDVQIPAELRGQTRVQVRLAVVGIASDPFTLTLSGS